MAGITRIYIQNQTTGIGTHRFWESRRRIKAANDLYRLKLNNLEEGEETLFCTKEEFEAGYDKDFGIDVILKFQNGMRLTLQEKFLLYHEDTITVEYYQNPITEEKGDWFNMICQLYFVGYDRNHLDCPAHPHNFEEETITGICYKCGRPFNFQSYILIDWVQTVISIAAYDNIEWQENRNLNDGARANFRYMYFKDIPECCIIAASFKKEKQGILFK